MPTPTTFRQTRDFGDGVPVPWFDAVFTTGQYDGFGAWGTEYLPECFADPRGNTEPAAYPGDVGRERYLSDGYRDHLMRNVTSIRLGVTARDLAATLPLLRAGGFTVRELPNGSASANGAGTTIRLDPVVREQAGLRQVEMSLNPRVSYRHEERIGRSTSSSARATAPCGPSGPRGSGDGRPERTPASPGRSWSDRCPPGAERPETTARRYVLLDFPLFDDHEMFLAQGPTPGPNPGPASGPASHANPVSGTWRWTSPSSSPRTATPMRPRS
ncbi:DUF5829 family protein [Streptomyces sp. NPDC058157]|uniref:DUF5829 family protein n=1 Tax=Streptomyces sp. NPDC058157 TaxID=3346360 RepID=UPI0036F0BE73